MRAAVHEYHIICTMRFSWSSLLFSCLNIAVNGVVGSVIERQTSPDVTVLHAYHSGTDLGVSTISPLSSYVSMTYTN